MDKMKLTVNALPINESFARSVIAAFAARINPTMDVLNDVKTAVSEGVTNAIVHGYEGHPEGEIYLEAWFEEETLFVKIRDEGVGISDVSEAMKDFFTTRPTEERSGLGFTIMQGFMDCLDVVSEVGKGTEVTMCKKLR